MLFAAHLVLLLATNSDFSQFLDRMRAISGPVWRTHTTSSSHISFGTDTTDVHSEAQGLRFATYDCRDGLCAGDYFDGERLYSININGTTLPSSDEKDPALRGERTIASLAFLAPDFTGQVTDSDFTVISGTRYRTLLVENGDGTAMDVYVDPKTALITYFREVNADTTYEYRDYRDVGGALRLPFQVYQNGKLLERYDARDTTSDAFAAPHGPTPVFKGAPAPVKTDADRAVPIVACTIGGVAANCLIDSGNSGLSMSTELRAKLSAQKVGSFRVLGLGDYSTDVVRGGNLEIGNATFPPANYVVLQDIHRFGYDVVLGADFFGNTTVSLDPAHNQITLGAKIPTKGSSVPIIFQNFVPILTVRLGNLGTQLALDTGDESNINLAYEFYQEHPDLFKSNEQLTVSGVGGTSVEMVGTIPSVRIGDMLMQQQRIGTTPALKGLAFGHLGAAFLSHFTTVIDYAGGRVLFTPPNP